MAASTSATLVKDHDVFLSFRGKDTRNTILSHLFTALHSKGIVPFQDNKRLKPGDTISDHLVKAIRTSWFAVVVLSKNYPDSKWCLEELKLIMELHVEEQIQVVPVFYLVEPADVRYQTGSFGIAFKRCKARRTAPEKVVEWREALKQISNLSGITSREGVSEGEMIAEIAGHISSRLLSMKPTNGLINLVGMEAHMMKMNLLLNLGSEDEVRIIGLWGMGGVGKTTIAECLYSLFSHGFSYRYFTEDVKKIKRKDSLLYLQKKILTDIFGNEHLKYWSVEAGSQEIMAKFKLKKVFLVLDGVDKAEQVHALAKDISWFGKGSRIIITTQDWGVLCSCGVKIIHEIECLDDEDALQVFQKLAFGGRPPPSDGFEQLFIRASRLAHGLPSALVAFASLLNEKTTIEGWEDELGLLEKVPHKNVKEMLKYSYEKLDDEDKNAFLHVACLLNGYSVRHITSLLDDGRPRINHLATKSLISISTDGCIIMHPLVVQTGREIVRHESKRRPFRQMILWEPNDIYTVLSENQGTDRIEGVTLHMCEMPDTLAMDYEVFQVMHNLKFLKFFHHFCDTKANQQLPSTGLYFPRNLRLLHFDAYPLKKFQSRFQLHHLVELNLRYSNVESIWDQSVNLQKLLRLDVTGCRNLLQLPDLSTAKNLEELTTEGCVRLERIPECLNFLKHLRKLNTVHCDRLKDIKFTVKIGTLRSGCSWRTNLMFPDVLVDLNSLTDLSIEGKMKIEIFQLSGTAELLSIHSEQQIPDELMNVAHKTVKLQHCSGPKSVNIKQFSYKENHPPFICHSFTNFHSLTELKLINLNIQEIPDDVDCLLTLETMDFSGNDFIHLPASMEQLAKLKYLNLGNCRKLTSLPQLTQVETLILSGCVNLTSLLEETGTKYSLLELGLNNCNKVQRLSDNLRHLTKLTYIDLSRHEFVTVPSSIRELLSLETLYLNNCKKLKSLEELPLSLKHLYAHGCDALSLNHSIKHLILQDGDYQEGSTGTEIPSYFDDEAQNQPNSD